jgi:hypothetical protein
MASTKQEATTAAGNKSALLDVQQLKQVEPFFVFLSNVKSVTGETACGLYDVIRQTFPGCRIFLDVEENFDIKDIVSYVNRSLVFIPLITKEYFERPICLIELAAAYRNNESIILPINVEKEGRPKINYSDHTNDPKAFAESLVNKNMKKLREYKIRLPQARKAFQAILTNKGYDYAPDRHYASRMGQLEPILNLLREYYRGYEKFCVKLNTIGARVEEDYDDDAMTDLDSSSNHSLLRQSSQTSRSTADSDRDLLLARQSSSGQSLKKKSSESEDKTATSQSFTTAAMKKALESPTDRKKNGTS